MVYIPYVCIHIYIERERERGAQYMLTLNYIFYNNIFLQQQIDHNNQSGIYIYSMKMEEII
jgi:hypothetical protein